MDLLELLRTVTWTFYDLRVLVEGIMDAEVRMSEATGKGWGLWSERFS